MATKSKDERGHGTDRPTSVAPLVPTNEDIAFALERMAALLDVQGAGPFRVAAYRNAAMTVRTVGQSVAGILDHRGRKGLEQLPGIGPRISSLIVELTRTGRISALDRLEGSVSPEDLFESVPGIGEKLAHELHDRLGIETLEELEIAAYDGRLESVPHIGQRRAEGIRQTLAGILSRTSRRKARERRWAESRGQAHDHPRPSVELLLDVDREYREKAEQGALRLITPRRFNPEGRAWLPVMHADRDGWAFNVMFSNTARAHQLGRTHDWVVIFFEQDGEEDQCTVVWQGTGPMIGKRVVRGREEECAALYRS